MSSINQVAISGNLGRDPELRATASGTQVCSFSVCVNHRKQENGGWVDDPNWVDVTFFGNRAEAIHKYLSKGSLVFVSGRLHQNKWEDKNGNKRSKLEVIGDEIHFGGGNQQQSQQQHQNGYQPPQGYRYAPQSPQQQPTGYQQPDNGYQEQMAYDEPAGVYDEDIPF